MDNRITLENAEVRLVIRPDLGGRIDQLYDKKTERNWLWHPENYDGVATRSLPIGASFDENWTGGWDEIFPNDAAGEFRGHALVDHGEFWSQPWEVVKKDDRAVQLKLHCQTVPVSVTKTIVLDQQQPEARIEYWLENQSDETIGFLFKQHAAIAIQEGDEILLPNCWIEPVAIGFSKLIGREEKTRFPHAFAADGQPIQVQFTPPQSSQSQEFYYSWDLAIGQCGIRNIATHSALIMQFDLADFPYVWVFQSYGGWRDHYVLVMEPSTTMPYDLEIAHQNGTIAQLNPHEVQQRALTVKINRA